jgi:exodeoxyribonuclease VII small subunit
LVKLFIKSLKKKKGKKNKNRKKKMETQPKNYGEAIAEVEAILLRFGDGSLDVDTLAVQVKRATELIAWCRERLTKAEKDVAAALDDSGKLKIEN